MVLEVVAAGIEAALQDLLLQQREVAAARVDFLDEFGRNRERLFDRLRQSIEVWLADMDRAEQIDRAGVAGDPPGEQFVLGGACPAGGGDEDQRQQGGETPHAGLRGCGGWACRYNAPPPSAESPDPPRAQRSEMDTNWRAAVSGWKVDHPRLHFRGRPLNDCGRSRAGTAMLRAQGTFVGHARDCRVADEAVRRTRRWACRRLA